MFPKNFPCYKTWNFYWRVFCKPTVIVKCHIEVTSPVVAEQLSHWLKCGSRHVSLVEMRVTSSRTLLVLCAVLYDCLTPDAVFIMRLMIASCFLVIVLSLTAGLMDVLGPTHIICQTLRSTACLSILSGAALRCSWWFYMKLLFIS